MSARGVVARALAGALASAGAFGARGCGAFGRGKWRIAWAIWHVPGACVGAAWIGARVGTSRFDYREFVEGIAADALRRIGRAPLR